MISTTDLLLGLQIALAVMLMILLYHSLFIAVNLRKIVKRVDLITEEVQEVIIKPISMADTAIEFINQWFAEQQKKQTTKEKKKVS